MKSFRVASNWNGDGIRLFNFRRFLEMREFDLREGDVKIVVRDDGEWDFFNPPKEKPKVEKPSLDEDKPPDEPKIKPKKEKPLCSKCGTYHWPMHKCPRKEN